MSDRDSAARLGVTVAAIDSASGTTLDHQTNTLTTGSAAGTYIVAEALVGDGDLANPGSDTLTPRRPVPPSKPNVRGLFA